MKIICASMDTMDERKIRIDPVSFAEGNGSAHIDMLRLDLLHPVVSGNKWYKLQPNLEAALAQGYTCLLSFGGAYSNHLVATAAAAKAAGLQSVGIVRGTYAQQNLTPTLSDCKQFGMQLEFVSREDYDKKDDPGFLQGLALRYEAYIVPEGGANEAGRSGAAAIARLIPQGYDYVCTAVGTGTTLIGLRNALPEDVQLFGFVPMKGGNYLEATIRQHILPPKDKSWQLTDEFHFGGFGKHNSELLQFMNRFYELNMLPLDVVYTAKMMYGIEQLLQRHYFPPGSKVLCIHSGGLQGNVSVQERLVY